jgi:hypothetical protein
VILIIDLFKNENQTAKNNVFLTENLFQTENKKPRFYCNMRSKYDLLYTCDLHGVWSPSNSNYDLCYGSQHLRGFIPKKRSPKGKKKTTKNSKKTILSESSGDEIDVDSM